MVTNTLLNKVARLVVQECGSAGIEDAAIMSGVALLAARSLTTMAVAGYKAGMSRASNTRRRARRGRRFCNHCGHR